MVNEHYERPTVLLLREPARLRFADLSYGVVELYHAAANPQWQPGSVHRVEDRKRDAWLQLFEERRRRAEAGRPALDRGIETPATESKKRRRIPESKRQTPEVCRLAGMPAARGQIVVAVEDGQGPRRQEIALGERVERTVEKWRVPAVEQIAGDDQMMGAARDDAIELPGELDRIGFISQMQV